MNDTQQLLVDRLSALPDKLRAEACFGKPVQHGSKTFIPVSRVCCGLGLGMGQKSLEPEHTQKAGGGGGGGGQVTPIAIVELSNEEVRVHPIMDNTRLLLGAATLIGWNVFWITKTIRALWGKSDR